MSVVSVPSLWYFCYSRLNAPANPTKTSPDVKKTLQQQCIVGRHTRAHVCTCTGAQEGSQDIWVGYAHMCARAPTSSTGPLHRGDCEKCVSLCFTGQRKEILTPRANLPVWLGISPSKRPLGVRPEMWLQLSEGGQFPSLCCLTTNGTPPTQTPGSTCPAGLTGLWEQA